MPITLLSQNAGPLHEPVNVVSPAHTNVARAGHGVPRESTANLWIHEYARRCSSDTSRAISLTSHSDPPTPYHRPPLLHAHYSRHTPCLPTTMTSLRARSRPSRAPRSTGAALWHLLQTHLAEPAITRTENTGGTCFALRPHGCGRVAEAAARGDLCAAHAFGSKS